MTTPVLHLFEAHLTVADLEKSITFYRDTIGLTLAHVTANRQAAFFWMGARGTTMLGLWLAEPGRPITTAHIAFATTLDEVLAAPQLLRSAGVTPLDFDGRPADEAVVLAWMPAASVYFRDPDGHLLEYIAMLTDDPRPGGGVVGWLEWRSRQAPVVDSDRAVVHVLAISGSLRGASSNSRLVRAAARLALSGISVSVYGELAQIPPFNPDRDTEPAPPSVAGFRAALHAADAVLISSPEYARGVSGVLKNALDWVVSSGELVDKPIAVINVSPRATHAHGALCETLATMSGRVIEQASITIPLVGDAVDADGNLTDSHLRSSLTSAMAALAAAVSGR